MTQKPKILVTSAAGKTGLPTALQLLERGYPVRAFVRRQDSRSNALKSAGADIFIGDQYSLSYMRKAMEGTQRAYQCAPTAPNGLHFNAVFTVAAFEARLEHVVTMSQWLSSASHPSLFTREVYLSDVLIAMRRDMSVTILRPGWFADNYLMVLPMAAHLGMFTMPLGDGDEKKNAPPSNEDIAAVAAGALMKPDEHAGKTYRPTGPDLMSPNDLANAMGRALGRKVAYNNISEKMMLKALKALPPSNYSEAAVSQLKIYADEYRRGAFAVHAPTDDVLKVAGHQAEGFESIVRRRLAADPSLHRSLPRTLGAMVNFVKILITRTPDVRRIEAQRDYVQQETPVFARDDPEWPGLGPTKGNTEMDTVPLGKHSLSAAE